MQEHPMSCDRLRWRQVDQQRMRPAFESVNLPPPRIETDWDRALGIIIASNTICPTAATGTDDIHEKFINTSYALVV